MVLLRLGPAAEHIVDRKQLDLGELGLVFLRYVRIARTIGIARGNLQYFR
jgi:hypothetical protein